MHNKTKIVSLQTYPPEFRLDQVVAEALALSRSHSRGLFDVDGVKVDGRFCSDGGQCRGTSMSLELKYIPGKKYQPIGHGWQNRPFHICFEDQSILVVEKQAGILTVPTEKRERNTLIAAIDEYLKRTDPRRPNPIAVHRLDRETSGLLVFAKDREIADELIGQFKEQKPERVYAVLVNGLIEKNTGTFESRFITDAFLNQQSSRKGDKGLLAITDYRVMTRLTDACLVHARLRTGRRNQIRVHFSEAGHPVIGDQRYKSEKATHRHWPHKRLALHALSLGFAHPRTGKPLTFDSVIPLEMDAFLRAVPIPAISAP